MAELSIPPLLAHRPEAVPALRGRTLLLPLLLAIVGIMIAQAAAIAGQQERRANDQTSLVNARLFWQNSLAQATLHDDPPAKIADLRDKLAAAQNARLAGYDAPGRHFTNWDGYRYEEIVRGGYVYDLPSDTPAMRNDSRIQRPGWPEPRTKNVVWYPLYPILGWLVMHALGISANAALTLIAELCAAGAAVIVFLYARRHYYNRMPLLVVSGDEALTQRHPSRRWELSPEDSGALWAVAALMFGPCAVFLYANYTESLFMLLLGLFLYCLQGRRWWWAAIVAGIAAASRSQGVLFGPVLALTYLARSDVRQPLLRLGIAVLLGIISATGILAFMAYLGVTFHDPLAFVHCERFWNVGVNTATLREALNPINALTDVLRHAFFTTPVDWPRLWEALCLIWPPVMLLILGGRFLSFELELVGWLLWGLPYVSNSLAGYPAEASKWMSMGRFMEVMLPAQIILGALIMRFRWAGVPLLALSSAAFAIFAYKFGAGQWVG